MESKATSVRNYSIKDIDPLIESIIELTGKTEEWISTTLERNEGYISQLRSREKKEGKPHVSRKFYSLLVDLHKKTLQNAREGKEVRENDRPLPIGDVNVTLKDYIDLLKQTNDRLFMALNSGLGRIHSDQQVALAYQKAWVEYEAERASEGDESKKKKIIYKMGKLVDGIMQDKPSEGNPGETRR